MNPVPRLIGVVHLEPLPGSPRFAADLLSGPGHPPARSLERSIEAAARDAKILADAGFDGVILENFGDAPFVPDRVEAVTVAAMTACCRAARAAAPGLALGVNVLRNDAEAALAVAIASDASFVRINVHVGARVTDQGLVAGRAHETLRRRAALGAGHVLLLCDVDVKHAAPLAPRPIGEEALELVERGMADAVLVTGPGTGLAIRPAELDAVLAAVRAPVLVASGATEAALPTLSRAHGVIVGSCLREDGRPGGAVDEARARSFAARFREAFV
jgi:membrane complex biogenesis BtpA family protein